MTEVKGYHAHIYYNAQTKPAAAKLRETIGAKFAAASLSYGGAHEISD